MPTIKYSVHFHSVTIVASYGCVCNFHWQTTYHKNYCEMGIYAEVSIVYSICCHIILQAVIDTCHFSCINYAIIVNRVFPSYSASSNLTS